MSIIADQFFSMSIIANWEELIGNDPHWEVFRINAWILIGIGRHWSALGDDWGSPVLLLLVYDWMMFSFWWYKLWHMTAVSSVHFRSSWWLCSKNPTGKRQILVIKGGWGRGGGRKDMGEDHKIMNSWIKKNPKGMTINDLGWGWKKWKRPFSNNKNWLEGTPQKKKSFYGWGTWGKTIH